MTRPAKIILTVGTYKGAFLFTSDSSRKRWSPKGPFLKGLEVNDFLLDHRSSPILFACANSSWFGAGIRFSKDFGKTWQEPEAGIRFEEGSERKVERVWVVAPGNADQPNVVYAGADPAVLFKSEDAGVTWSEVKGLGSHPTRQQWSPGAGGLMVHSICLDHRGRETIAVGISAAGVFHTKDGGKTWEPRNTGVLADFLPEKYPDVGQCVHHLEMHPDQPDMLYQQNHCGVYRSENGGREWIDISEGLPSRFGFPLILHPKDPDTVFVIPEEGPEFRSVARGSFSVYRSRNKGKSWKKLSRGLPSKHAYTHVYRQATAADPLDRTGLYVGTSNGQIYYSLSDGDSWNLLAEHLPPIYSLRAAIS